MKKSSGKKRVSSLTFLIATTAVLAAVAVLCLFGSNLLYAMRVRNVNEQRAEVEEILSAEAAPTFENTVRALELSGQLLRRVAPMFFTLVGSDGTDARQALAEELSPELAAHEDAILLDPRLAERVAAVDDAALNGEDDRLLHHLRVRLETAGAQLDEAACHELRRNNGGLGDGEAAKPGADERALAAGAGGEWVLNERA